MDPKTSTQLDPKLQEAYNKIMGVSLTSSAPTDPASISTQPITTEPAFTPPTAEPAISPTPIQPISPTNIPTPIPSDTSAPPIQSLQDNPTPVMPSSPVVQLNTPVSPQQQTDQPLTEKTDGPMVQKMTTVENTASLKPQTFVAKSGGYKISPVILAVGGIVFLILYTIIWIKVFNIPVPFINQ